MTKLTASLLTALLVSSAAASNLRVAEQPERKLQLANQLLNSLLNEFTPLIAEFMQDELSYYDPITSLEETTVDLGNTTFDGACPNSSANLTYGLGNIVGMSDLTIETLELVSGSEDITVSFLALDGATWAGDWLINFNWPNVTAETSVRLEANLCGFPIDQTITGSATVLNTSVQAKAAMAGETDNVLQFRASSQVTEIVVESVELQVGNVTADFGMAGSVIQQLNINESLEQTVLTTFANDIEPFIVNVANAWMETNAPFPLAESTTDVTKSSP